MSIQQVGQQIGKPIAVVAGEKVHDFILFPGTTAQDIINGLGLPPEYRLSRADALQFGGNEELYGVVEVGEKLHASPPANVGV